MGLHNKDNQKLETKKSFTDKSTNNVGKKKSHSYKKTSIALVALLCATFFGLAACGSDPTNTKDTSDSDSQKNSKEIVMGSADFPSNKALAEVYAGALKSKGYKVSTKLGIGSREVYLKALTEGTIDAIPEYTGNLLLALDSKSTAKSSDQINSALSKKLPKGQKILTPSKAEDKDAIVVTSAFAEEKKLQTIEDLSKICSDISLGAPPEFKKRTYGLPGLKKNYDCVPKEFKALSDGGGSVTVNALKNNEVQAADIFTSSPEIADNMFVTLEDPKNNFIAQQVVPLIKTDQVDSGAQDVMNDVSSKLTTQSLVELNRAMSGNTKKSPEQAAQQWLSDNGFTNKS